MSVINWNITMAYSFLSLFIIYYFIYCVNLTSSFTPKPNTLSFFLFFISLTTKLIKLGRRITIIYKVDKNHKIYRRFDVKVIYSYHYIKISNLNLSKTYMLIEDFV